MGDQETGAPVEDRRMFRREEGQTMAEYGVTLAVITPMVIIAFALLSNRIFEIVSRAVALIP
jgi:Flp pilus assembly pilin Flp